MMEYEFMAEEYERHRKKKEFKEKLHTSTEYIDWLEEFTKKYKVFATDSFLYDEDKINEEEKENISLLEALFETIYEYADDNYIESKTNDYEVFFDLEHNGIGYQIGLNYGQGSAFYCLRKEEPEKDSIKFEQLMTGEKLPSTIITNMKLEELEKYIESLVEENVPVEAIHRKTDTVLQKVKVMKGKK